MGNVWIAVLACYAMAGAGGGRAADQRSLQLGIGVRDASRFCVAVEGPRFRAGSRVIVVSPLNKSWGEAVVVEVATQPCPGTSDGSKLTSYELRPLKGDLQKSIALVGVFGGLGGFSVSPSNVIANDAGGKNATFRGCLADGGVYLMLWSGKPLEGELLWHGFRFVDFDMDAENCTPKDEPK